jgi:phosphohistidine swiveling domain-containing protein
VAHQLERDRLAGRAGLRVAVFGADTMLGRGVAARLITLGHEVVGVGQTRPESWSGAVGFVPSELATGVLAYVLAGVDAVALCGSGSIETDALLGALATSTIHVVAVSSPEATALQRGGVDLITVRCGVGVGRDAEDDLVRLFTTPWVTATRATIDRPLRVVHPHDLQRVLVSAVIDGAGRTGTYDVAAKGRTTIRAIATALGRSSIVVPESLRVGTDALFDATPAGPVHPLPEDWAVAPSWTAGQCVDDFVLACRGRVTVRRKVVALPWRLPRVRDIPAVDSAAADGVKPVAARKLGGSAEFDTPIDPRFPAFVATNLSEALPGPFSPSSASVTVLGTRAAGMVVSQRLRPGGAVQSEMSRRSTAVFGHRLYAGLTSGYFMAQTVPFVNSDIILAGFFGRTADGVAVLGAEPPPIEPRGALARLRGVATFANNLVTLSAGGGHDTRDFSADVARFEEMTEHLETIDDDRLRALILLGRDHVVQGWVLASASILLCTAYGVILRVLCGRDVRPAAGIDVTSAQSLGAVHRLAAIARDDPETARLLTDPGFDEHLLAAQCPLFCAALAEELALIGHRGPGEVEIDCATYSDNPGLLIGMVAKALHMPPRALPAVASVPFGVRPITAAAAVQLRAREVRRDRMVRAIWVLRKLLREYGRRRHDAGALTAADDVFYLTVDELVAPPRDIAATVARRRTERDALRRLFPPEAFSGEWAPVAANGRALTAGESVHGMGVSEGRVRGRVRVIQPGTIDELQPGEILVTKVTDIGYTPAFAYAAAVVTELGGPLSHAAIVAREYGVPCVVNVRGAADRLPTGALIEVDGLAGSITVLSES